jgi:nitrite reductase/ring-hydroxylating ferredoxin subunit
MVAKTKGGTDVLVVKLDGTIHAMGAKCTHAGGPLAEGKWVGKDRCELQCPWHQSVFSVKDGSVKQGPATFPEPVFEVKTGDGGSIEVRAR